MSMSTLTRKLALTTLIALTCTSEAWSWSSTTGRGVVESPPNTFHIPRCGYGRKLGYVTVPWRTPITASNMIVAFEVAISPGGKIVGFESMGGTRPVQAAMLLQRRYDDYGLRKYNQGYRWWSRKREPLTAGYHHWTVPLQRILWTGGGTQLDYWWDMTRRYIGNVGVTFSDTQSAGHGVCMQAGTGYIRMDGLAFQ